MRAYSRRSLRTLGCDGAPRRKRRVTLRGSRSSSSGRPTSGPAGSHLGV